MDAPEEILPQRFFLFSDVLHPSLFVSVFLYACKSERSAMFCWKVYFFGLFVGFLSSCFKKELLPI